MQQLFFPDGNKKLHSNSNNDNSNKCNNYNVYFSINIVVKCSVLVSPRAHRRTTSPHLVSAMEASGAAIGGEPTMRSKRRHMLDPKSTSTLTWSH